MLHSELLAQIPLFDTLSTEDTEALAKRLAERKFAASSKVFDKPAPSGSNLSLCGPANSPCGENGIFVLADEGYPVCTTITGNNIFDLSSFGFDIYLAERAGPPVGAQLTLAGSGAVTTYLNANNTLAGASKRVDEGGNVTTGAACAAFP